MTENYEQVNPFPLRIRGGMPGEDFQQNSSAGMQSRGKREEGGCALNLEVFRGVCHILMSIFFLCGSEFFRPSTVAYYDGKTPSGPTTFIALGAVLYIAALMVDVCKRMSRGWYNAVPSCVGIFGASLWFIGTIASFHITGENMRVPSVLWVIGTVLVLIYITYDLFVLVKSDLEKPLFHALALVMAWLANVLFLSGGIALVSLVTSIYITLCDLEKYAGLYIAGSVFYLLHSIFFVLAMYRKDITITIKSGQSNYHIGNQGGSTEDIC